jgi:hypothetical protein
MDRQQFTAFLSELRPLLERLDPATKQKYLPRVLALVRKLESQVSEQESQTQPAPEQPVVQATDIAKQLWTLARGNADVFTAYAQSYPDSALQAVASNPAEINALIQKVGAGAEIEPRVEIDGIRQAPLQSSNVFGYRYNPLRKELAVRFNEGQVYRYSGVPQIVFDMFRHGEGTARTTGSNKYGRWWKNKRPSMGASVHQLLIAGGFQYRRVR